MRSDRASVALPDIGPATTFIRATHSITSNAELVRTVSHALSTVGLATESADGLREEIGATMA
jgi:hypothetical protein